MTAVRDRDDKRGLQIERTSAEAERVHARRQSIEIEQVERLTQHRVHVGEADGGQIF